MKKYKHIALILAASVVSTAAAAQSPAPAYNWTGFYLGAHGGYLRSDHDLPGTPFSAKPDGGYGGFQIGYWAHFSPNWVYGFEADISFSDANSIDNGIPLSVWLDRFGTARSRLGYATGPWLIYATGGAAWTKASLGTVSTQTRQAFTGWTAGIGAEYAIAPNWSVKAEYLFADLGSNTQTFAGFGVLAQDITFSTFRVGLNYRLGGALPAANTSQRSRFDWTGAYIGVHGGFANGWQNLTIVSGTAGFKPDGGLGGFQGGYNFQFASNVVLGIESDFSFAGIKGNFEGDCCIVRIKQFGTARLRAGYAIDNLLFYGTGGVAWAKTDNSYLFSFITSDGPFVGWTGGAGIEYAFSPTWTVKAEYLRVYFDDNRSNLIGLTPFIEQAKYSFFRVGLNYRASLFDIIAGR